MHELWTARDWGGIVAMISPAIRTDDRRRIVRLEIGYDEFIAQLRMVFDQPGNRWSAQLLATRGERLSLSRTRFEAEVADGGGPLAIDDHLSLAELDAEGRIVAFVTFDLEDEGAAWAELDARWNTGEGAQHAALRVMREFGAGLERRDWDVAVACYAPEFVGHDHRLVSWGTVHGPSALLRALQEMVVLAPDARMRLNHRRACARGTISDITWVGTREGGAFESPFVNVAEAGGDGRIVRADFYDPHHLARDARGQ
jgi:hypothetical protein